MRLADRATVALLASTALVNALVPLLFARAIDALGPRAGARSRHPAAIVLAYVGVQWLAKVLSELRWSLYGPIEQRAAAPPRAAGARAPARPVARLPPRPPHRADQPDPEQRPERARELLFDGVFLILPLVAEMLFVTVVMLARLDRVFAAILVGTLALYGCRLVIGSEWLRPTSARPWPRARPRTARRSTAC